MTKLSAPRFWQSQFHPLALALWPIGKIYQIVTQIRIQNAKNVPDARVPVICIGNATAGGTGKTPLVQDIVARLQTMGRVPHILLRGYGGLMETATRVDSGVHDALDVGDEALLHAAIAPTWVGRDRYASACAAIAAGADILVMDDGLQNTSIRPSARWLVVDSAQGFANGYGIPAGPLRENPTHALARVDAVILVGNGNFAPRTDKPILRVSIGTDENSLTALQGKLIYAFAGIGQPERLRAGLIAAGLDVVGARSFPDHHTYSAGEIAALRRRAKLLGAELVTTQKDFVRLSPHLRAEIIPVDVKVGWNDPGRLQEILEKSAAFAG